MARKGFPSDRQDQFMLRLPDGMRDRIKAAAEANKRSMNAEIIDTLERAYPPNTINVETLSQFLADLASLQENDNDKEYLRKVNGVLAQLQHPWTVEPGWDGVIKFYPVATVTQVKNTRPRNDPPTHGKRAIDVSDK